MKKNLRIILKTWSSKHNLFHFFSIYSSRKKTSGFTIIELVLYATLVALLSLGIASFWDITKQAGLKDKSISIVEEEGVFAADVIGEHIRTARRICIPSGSGSTESTLDLDSNCTVHTGNHIVFTLSGGRLIMTENGSDIPLTDARAYISSITFANAGGSSIDYSFTMESKNYSSTDSFGYSKIFSGGGTIRQ